MSLPAGQWRLPARIAAIVLLLLIALFAFGQAMAVVSLSAPHADQSALTGLTIRFWACIAVAMASVIIAALVVVRWIREINRKTGRGQG
jgi:membrane protein implicated in regulation of membrane protease activity